jgi:MazG family protein
MHRLRSPGGCPWDREQTHRTLARHLLEETHETIDAIDSGDPGRLREELGDVLLQVMFHAEIAMQEGSFDIDDVADGIVQKLIHRHPHVFGDAQVDSSAQVLVNWERIKEQEKGRHEVDHDIPAALPALLRAAKVQRRAGGSGFEWPTREAALAALRREVEELEAVAGPDDVERELGDVLFAAVAVARKVGVDPESALRGTIRRFSDRFERMRSEADRDGVDLSGLSAEELEARFRAAR